MPPELEIIRPLSGGAGEASVELVRRSDGQFCVLKKHRLANIAAERMFQKELKARGLPHLEVIDHAGLAANQILLEYLDGSPTIGGSFSQDVCERWGAAVGALHRQKSDTLEIVDQAGQRVKSDWSSVLDGVLRDALNTHPASDLPEHLLKQAKERLAALHSFRPAEFVLTHGDLHANNALVRGGDIVLFDKASGVWTAPAIFDVCLIFSEAFPGARYNAPRDGNDPERLAAFLRGYGDVPTDQEEWLDHFVLLRSLRRYPNPFVPTQRFVIETALERISR